MSENPKRNDICPCGSGKRFKHCCGSHVTDTSATNKKRLSGRSVPSDDQLKPRVLMLSLQNWPQACRIPKYLQVAGFSVVACVPKTELLNLSAFLDMTYEAPPPDQKNWLGLLGAVQEACAKSRPDYLLACDEASIQVLNQLYESVKDSQDANSQRVKNLLIDSKGAPANYRLVQSKHQSCSLMRKLGFRVPDQIDCRDYHELRSAAAHFGYPLVVKGEFGVAGLGVSICRSDNDLPLAWKKAGRVGAVVAQQYISGTPVFCTAAAFRGRFLAGNVFRKIACNPDHTGPSSVVQVCEQAEITRATRQFVEQTAFSGILGLDFIESNDGSAFFLECNPRPVPATHLGHIVGNDLFLALKEAVSGNDSHSSIAAAMTIALFPQEVTRDSRSPHLWNAYHDVPWDEPLILRALLARELDPS